MKTLGALCFSFLIICSVAYAQQPPPKLTTLTKAPVSGQPDKEFLLFSVEWPAGSGTPLHTHLGDEYGVVIEGAYMVKQGDQDWQTYNAGQSWHVSAGIVHESRNAVQTKTMNAFIVEKDKPLIHPFKKP